MNRNRKIRTVYRKRYPHGKYRYIINLYTESKSRYKQILNYVPNDENTDLIAFCKKSLKDHYKLKYRKNNIYYSDDRVLSEIFLVNEGDIMMLKMCFPQFIYSIKKIELQNQSSVSSSA